MCIRQGRSCLLALQRELANLDDLLTKSSKLGRQQLTTIEEFKMQLYSSRSSIPCAILEGI